jgi:cathepsin F
MARATAVVVAVLALIFAAEAAKQIARNPVSDLALFRRFMIQHGKSYGTTEERTRRFATFKDNLDRINRLNAANPGTDFGINKFADMSAEEFKSIYMSSKVAVRNPEWPVAAEVSQAAVDALPTSFDWRDKGAVTPVKNQGQCGSCWSFSTTGNIEGRWFLANHSLINLSEQNLVDCDHECMKYENQNVCDQGCDGGLMPNAFTYVIKNGGIDQELAYPYEGVDGQCRFKANAIGAKISNFTMLSTDEDQIAAYLYANGPVSIAADAEEWQFYTGGVFRAPCGKQLDHGILLTGFGVGDLTSSTIKWWWVKNSWGADWGLQGYLKVERGVGKCGLNEFACSSIV